MEGLNNMIKVANNNRWMTGFKVASSVGGMEVTHLLYADDTLVFCDAKEEELRHLKIILTIFEAVSGLHVNWRKSLIFPVNEVTAIQRLTGVLGCTVGTLPTTYLGLPLGSKNKSLDIWSRVLERCEKRLAKWKSQYISLGGRVTLVNSVLDALPTYMMSLFPIPTKIEKRINVMRRNFIWQGNKEKGGYHLVNWKVLTQAKKSGGLGIRNLRLHNKSLLMKWLWRFGREDETLWRQVIIEKYGLEGQWIPRAVTTTYGVSVWRSIRAYWPLFAENISIVVGNGRKTSFWNDNWLGHGPLKDLFSDMKVLSLNNEATVEDNSKFEGLGRYLKGKKDRYRTREVWWLRGIDLGVFGQEESEMVLWCIFGRKRSIAGGGGDFRPAALGRRAAETVVIKTDLRDD
ncbi:PREDICTED: uncharacterized protein LOC109236002 [Nicotiana attenuata]|uniref:uncharacterized protein LOC109236002 n=1 Tax=Nicotiana attenuata TaxID=49451 RepID=UPI0009045F26|nr:PREDICTED: uncharacterized protein LOC109236002 [Nicotiana attenuata]